MCMVHNENDPSSSIMSHENSNNNNNNNNNNNISMMSQSNAEYAGKLTGRIIESIINDSNILTNETLDHVTKLNPNEIQIGRLLGKGGFNFVRKVHLSSSYHHDNEECCVMKYLNFEKVKKGK